MKTEEEVLDKIKYLEEAKRSAENDFRRARDYDNGDAMSSFEAQIVDLENQLYSLRWVIE